VLHEADIKTSNSTVKMEYRDELQEEMTEADRKAGRVTERR